MSTEQVIGELEVEEKPNVSSTSSFTSSGFLNQRVLIAIGLIGLGILSTAFLITIIVQGANNKSTTTNNNVRFCQSQGCLSASAHQLRSMDKTAFSDRCTDFYTYACGGWQHTRPIEAFERERTILGDVLNRRNADIERLLNSPIQRVSEKSWEKRVKTYYKECIDDYARVLDSGKALVDLLSDSATVGGWFLLNNNRSDTSQEFLLQNQTVYDQIMMLHGDLGANVIFGLRTRFDDLDPSIKRLEFHPSGLTMEINDYLGNDDDSKRRRSAYQVYVNEVLNLISEDAGISDPNLYDRITTVFGDVLNIETQLAQALRRSLDSGEQTTTTTLKEISDRFSFDFVELMTHELGDPAVLPPASLIFLSNKLYFDDVFALLAKNNDPTIARSIHNYMRWKLVHTYINDLSYNYIHSYRMFLNTYYNSISHSTNDQYCTREVLRRFPLAIYRLYTMNLPTNANGIQIVQTMFDKLKTAFKNYIDQQATWMNDKETKESAKSQIDTITAAIGYASIASNDTLLDDYYDRFAVVDTSHLANAYAYHLFRNWVLAVALVQPNKLDHWDFFETRPNRLFDYIGLFSRLFITTTALNEPLINAAWPWTMNMGSLGVLLAQELFSSIDGSDSGSTVTPGWWSESTTNEYTKSRKCINDYYVNEIQTLSYNVNGAEILINLAGEPFSPTTLRHIAALRFSYSAFKENDELKSFLMPATNLTSEQAFFLAYAQTQCYQRPDSLQMSQTKSGIYDERTALNAALVHMPEFSAAFQCKPRQNQCF